MPTVERKPQTILLVDDENTVLDLVTKILEEEGYSVLPAAGGREGLTIAQTHKGRIDLLLTDIVMPGMSGGELARQVQELCPGIRVLYMSGYTKYTAVGHGALESVDSFIWKPFNSGQLLRKVLEVLTSPSNIPGPAG